MPPRKSLTPTLKTNKTAKNLGLKRSEVEDLSEKELQLMEMGMACSDDFSPASEKTTNSSQLKKRKINKSNSTTTSDGSTDGNHSKTDDNNKILNPKLIQSRSVRSPPQKLLGSSNDQTLVSPSKTTTSLKSPSKRRISTSPKTAGQQSSGNNTPPTSATFELNHLSEINTHNDFETQKDVSSSSNLDSIADYLEEGESFQFSDTHIGLLKIRQEIQSAILSCKHKMKFFFPPVVLKHFLFHENIIPNQTPTQIEKTLNEMIQSHEIRRFYIDRKMYKDIFGFVFTEDYISSIKKQYESYLEQLERHESSPEDDSRVISGIPYFIHKNQEESRRKLSEPMKKQLSQVISNFCENVLLNVTEPFIDRTDLVDCLFPDSTEESSRQIDDGITLLMTIGALTIKDTNSFYFAIPNLSQFMFYIDNGRKEILSILRRKQFKEIMVHSLLQRPLKNTIFNPMFHIRDMIGDGDVYVIDINGQKMIRIR
ncbi:hypothetical protein C9374_004033 [Naegleria lovaniensis]|uniref:Uncharacterized protein n=1 Tax=Naegleria lovaniensis TaxID=51637 RepID=A0AA88KT92_NAELO|nr:uncharacterized protein C9374_004033 [Naegleria lovaniensis]KAG2394269.1 hypothetical protein C9374_004033 [Naegleria lovaniensis]